MSWPFDDLMNMTETGDEIPICGLWNANGGRVKEIHRVTAIGEIERKSEKIHQLKSIHSRENRESGLSSVTIGSAAKFA